MDTKLRELLAGAGLEPIVMPRKEYIAEHKHLLKILAPVVKEREKQKKEMEERTGAGIAEDKRWLNSKTPYTIAKEVPPAKLNEYLQSDEVPPSMKDKLMAAKTMKGGRSQASGFVMRMMAEAKKKHGSQPYGDRPAEDGYKNPTKPLHPQSTMNWKVPFDYKKLANANQNGSNTSAYGASPFIIRHFANAQPNPGGERAETAQQRNARRGWRGAPAQPEVEQPPEAPAPAPQQADEPVSAEAIKKLKDILDKARVKSFLKKSAKQFKSKYDKAFQELVKEFVRRYYNPDDFVDAVDNYPDSITTIVENLGFEGTSTIDADRLKKEVVAGIKERNAELLEDHFGNKARQKWFSESSERMAVERVPHELRNNYKTKAQKNELWEQYTNFRRLAHYYESHPNVKLPPERSKEEKALVQLLKVQEEATKRRETQKEKRESAEKQRKERFKDLKNNLIPKYNGFIKEMFGKTGKKYFVVEHGSWPLLIDTLHIHEPAEAIKKLKEYLPKAEALGDNQIPYGSDLDKNLHKWVELNVGDFNGKKAAERIREALAYLSDDEARKKAMNKLFNYYLRLRNGLEKELKKLKVEFEPTPSE